MKRMILLVPILLAVAGCTLLPTPDEQPIRFVLDARGQSWGTIVSLDPSEDEGGVAVQISTDGIYWVDWGDGTNAEELTTARGDHTYRYEGTYTVRVYDGARSATGRVTVLNAHPKIYGPFVPQASEGWGLEWRELATFDFCDQYKGCDGSGAPLTHYGVDDPDGDVVLIRLTVSGPDGNGNIVDYSVYDYLGNYVNGTFIGADYLYPWIGWAEVDPLAPIFPRGPGHGWMSLAGLLQLLACDPVPWLPPGISGFGAIAYKVEAKDRWMRDEDAVVSEWSGFLASAPTCN